MGRIVAFCLFLIVSISGNAYGQSLPPLVRYDNFNQNFLDPNKWATSSPCFTWTVLDCVREIQNGQLRLAVRGFGGTDSNQGSQYAESELHFLRPSTIKSIATDLVLRRLNGSACASNTDPPGGHAILQGTFFNSGTGDPNDDVQGLLLIDNRSPSVEPGVADVCSMLHWQGQFFDGVCLGRINFGQKIKAQLTWDQSNHQFLSSFTDPTTGVVAQESMPYSMPDTRPAAAPDKLIGVRVWGPNCVGRQGLASDIEATFDSVMVGTPAHED
jgi:hypothetical protein